MARILFTLPRFHTNMWFAVRRMLADGHQVELLVNTAAGTSDYSLLKPVEMGRHPTRADVQAEVDRFDPDVVFVRNAWALSRRAARAARKRGVPVLVYNQTPCEVPTTLPRRVQLWWKGLPAQRVTPVRLPGGAVACERFAHYLPWPVGPLRQPVSGRVARGDRLRVLLVGKLQVPRKNQDRLIEALRASDLTDRISLTLVGQVPGRESEHVDRLKALAELDWITLAGPHPFDKMDEMYLSHDVCILPSHAEPLGTSPVEGMAYGTVPIISDECGSAGYLTDGEDGFIIDPDRLETAVTALRRLVEEPGLLKRMQARALETYGNELSEDAFSNRLSRLLAEVGAGRQKG